MSGGWNHRVVRHDHDGGHSTYRLHEVYYAEDGTVEAWTAEPVDVAGDSVQDIKDLLALMVEDVDRPVLVASELEATVRSS